MPIFNAPGFNVSDIFAGWFDRRQDVKTRLARLSLPELIEALMATASETQQATLARAVLLRYHHGDPDQHHAFFDYLLEHMDLDTDLLASAVDAYRETAEAAPYATLMRATEPRRKELFRRLAAVKGGAACLVKIREDIRRDMRDKPALGRLDQDLHHLLSSWFNRGFLELRAISWESPAHVLEKIIAYEAVHSIRDWDDLRRRLQPHDRRCYGFFHPRMPDDPIIFVEVALTPEIPGSVDALLSDSRELGDASALTTAAFYSISNCHAGLAGISFGNALIKRVVRDLSAELPQIKTFVTLSPIPGLRRWNEAQDTPIDDVGRAAATYLATAKREAGDPLDPVARFHLGNGAMLHAVHMDANSSDAGQSQSYGAMVNYLYE
ncbi:MAG: malonyl-CoA decarboxylase family protein, partial [Pseudomonadota bacterium]